MAPRNPVIATNIYFRNFLNSFLHNESIGGIVLMFCSLVALLCANVPQLGFLHDIWKTDMGFTIGSFSLEMTLEHWINDALMAVFFFVVGLEIKREMMVGELSSIK